MIFPPGYHGIDKLTELYDFNLIGEADQMAAVLCSGYCRKERCLYRRKSWVDKERFIGLKEELYARSGRLLKVMTVGKVAEFEDRWYPVESVMEDKLRKDTRTEFYLKSIEFNPEIPASTFTLENLR